MKLFKNVDICDINSVLNKGILSMDECGNNNWEDGLRGDNATDVVYLFKPTSEQNSFAQYGVALVEVEVDDAIEVEMLAYDVHNPKNKDSEVYGAYKEYTCRKVAPENIKAIYIPKLFKDRITTTLDSPLVHFVHITAKVYDHYDHENHKSVYCDAEDEILEQFGKTAEFEASNFNFFRGIAKDNTMIDLYDVHYEF